MSRRISLILDCADKEAMASFWTQALGWERLPWEVEQYAVIADRERGLVLSFQEVPEPKSGKNRMHLDVHAEDLDAEITRMIALGASRAENGPLQLEAIRWQTMHDPEGNEFCVVTP